MSGLSTSNRATEAQYITRIVVHGLFDHYCYEINANERDSRLVVLYGDNGSGKTTILKLVFHLLASRRSRGHKSIVARIPFDSVRIELANGTTFIAFRNEKERKTQSRGFRLDIRRPGHDVETTRFRAAPDGTVMSEIQPPTQPNFLQRLEEVAPRMYFISDDRNIHGVDQIESETDDAHYRRVFGNQRERHDYRTLELRRAIRRAETWLREQTLTAVDEASQNSNVIYENILNRIAKPSAAAVIQSPFGELSHRIADLASRSRHYARFGLVAELHSTQLLDALEAAEAHTRSILASVLSPYLDGIQARLDALSDIHAALDNFLDAINSYFFSDKKITFGALGGLKIFDVKNKEIDPQVLSSGEKHLLTILCNLLAMRQQRAIFLIDEPELSLNAKWQRKLIDTMLAITHGSAVQFIIATHAFELIAPWKSSVVRVQGAEHGTPNH